MFKNFRPFSATCIALGSGLGSYVIKPSILLASIDAISVFLVIVLYEL